MSQNPHTDLDGHTPARIIAIDEVATRIVEVRAATETLYLRDDVSLQQLMWAMRLLDIAKRQQEALESGDYEAFTAASEERDRETLNVATTIVRHSYPDWRRTDVEQRLPPETREAVVAHFFTNRLTPYLQHQVDFQALSQLAETPVTAAEEPAATTTAMAAVADTEGVTPSPRRSSGKRNAAKS